MARPIRILVIGDSISAGAVSDYNQDGSYAVTTDKNAAWIGKLAVDLEDRNPGEYELTCCALGGSTLSGWLRGSITRTHSNVANVPANPAIPNLTVPPGPGEPPLNGQTNLWDWGIAPYLPADLVMIMGELNQLRSGRGTKPTNGYQIFWTLTTLLAQLRDAGANAVMVSCHGQPDRDDLGYGEAIPPGNAFLQTMNQLGDSILGLQWLVDWLVKGVDSRAVLTPSTSYGLSLIHISEPTRHDSGSRMPSSA